MDFKKLEEDIKKAVSSAKQEHADVLSSIKTAKKELHSIEDQIEEMKENARAVQKQQDVYTERKNKVVADYKEEQKKLSLLNEQIEEANSQLVSAGETLLKSQEFKRENDAETAKKKESIQKNLQELTRKMRVLKDRESDIRGRENKVLEDRAQADKALMQANKMQDGLAKEKIKLETKKKNIEKQEELIAEKQSKAESYMRNAASLEAIAKKQLEGIKKEKENTDKYAKKYHVLIKEAEEKLEDAAKEKEAVDKMRREFKAVETKKIRESVMRESLKNKN